MEVKGKWYDKPITREQVKVLRDLASESFNVLTRREAADLIEQWYRSKEKSSYDNDVLEENK